MGKKTAVAYNPLLSYVWSDDNKGSPTRSNNFLYSYNAMVDFVNAIDYVVGYLNGLEREDINIVDRVVGNLIYIYWMLQTPSWRDESKKEYYEALRKRTGQFEKKYNDVWNYITTKDAHFAQLYIDRYSMQFESEKFIPQETFDEFIEDIRK
jgi:hypothetical protein